MKPFLLQCPFRREDVSKLERALMSSPPPSWPIKVSPRWPLLDTRFNHQSACDRNHADQCSEREYYVFPSSYHKYINYANYEHCILTKTHSLSPFHRCTRTADKNRSLCYYMQLTALLSLIFSQPPLLNRSLLQFVSVTHN